MCRRNFVVRPELLKKVQDAGLLPLPARATRGPGDKKRGEHVAAVAEHVSRASSRERAKRSGQRFGLAPCDWAVRAWVLACACLSRGRDGGCSACCGGSSSGRGSCARRCFRAVGAVSGAPAACGACKHHAGASRRGSGEAHCGVEGGYGRRVAPRPRWRRSRAAPAAGFRAALAAARRSPSRAQQPASLHTRHPRRGDNGGPGRCAVLHRRHARALWPSRGIRRPEGARPTSTTPAGSRACTRSASPPMHGTWPSLLPARAIVPRSSPVLRSDAPKQHFKNHF